MNAGRIAKEMADTGAQTLEDFIIRRWTGLPPREMARQWLAASEPARRRVAARISEEDRARLQDGLNGIAPEERKRVEAEGAGRRATEDERWEREKWMCDGCGVPLPTDGIGEPVTCTVCTLCRGWCCECGLAE